MIIANLRLDAFRENNIPILKIPQGDYNGREIRAVITSLGERVSVSDKETVQVSATRPDGTTKAFAGKVNDDGTVSVPVARWMLDLEGEVTCSVSVSRGDSKYTTNDFIIDVAHSPDAGTSGEDDLNPGSGVVVELTAQISALDVRLDKVEEALDSLEEKVDDIEFDAPHIGENGNWFVNGEDTGVQASGTNGTGIRKINLVQSDKDENGKPRKKYRIYFTDDTTFDYTVYDGIGIEKIELLSTGQDEYGRPAKKYRIYYTDGTTFDYIVYDGLDGEDGEDGVSPTVEVSELKETIPYTQADGLVAIPEGAKKVTAIGTCSGYMTGGKIYFVLVNGDRNIISNAHIGSGTDTNVLDAFASLDIPKGAAYIGTYPFIDETFTDSRNNSYSCDLSVKFSDFEQGGATITITDVNDTKSVNLYNGENGLTPHIGANGNWWLGETDTGVKAKGENGVGVKYISLMQTTTDDEGRVKRDYDVFDTNNAVVGSFTVTDGKDGYSPARGTDYWTEADKAEIKSYVDNAILGGAW